MNNLSALEKEITSQFREKYGDEFFVGKEFVKHATYCKAVEDFILSALRKQREMIEEEMLRWCDCLKCKTYRSAVVDSRKVYRKLKEENHE